MDVMERKVDALTATYLASSVATRDARPTVLGELLGSMVPR